MVHTINDMGDVIIESIPAYDLNDQMEVPTVVGEEEIISSKAIATKGISIQSEIPKSESYPNLVPTDDISKFIIHGKRNGQKDTYRCVFCTKVFSYVSRLKLHLRVHTGEKPYACSICDFTASYKKSVEVHMRSHTGEKPYACSICDFRAARKANVDDHMRVHTGEKPFACPLCDFRSAQQSAVTCHLRRHTGEKKFNCTICNFRTAYKHILEAHHRVHTGERPFACALCEYRGSTKLNVRLHMRRHTGEKPYACSMCDFRSTKRYSVKLHMRRHTGEKPFQCTQCNYSAAQKFCLMKHMAKHESTWYSCSTCEFKTPNTKRLASHIKKHVLTKESPCPECGITFINNLLLMDHMASNHSYFDHKTIQEICNGISEYEELSVYEADVKQEPITENYKCMTCSFVTGNKYNFEVHLQSHDLLHSCKFCDLKFPNPKTMYAHLTTKHRSMKRRVYVCPFCTNLFADRFQIVKHLRNSHTLLKVSLSNEEEMKLFEENSDISEECSIYPENAIKIDKNLIYSESISDDMEFDEVPSGNLVRSVVFRTQDGTLMTSKRVVVGATKDSQ